MHKVIYLIRGKANEDYGQFGARILRIGKSLSRQLSQAKIKVSYTAVSPPRFSIIPFKKHKVAAISILHHNTDALSELTFEDEVVGTYSAIEAIPVAYQRSWPDLETTPGVCLLTLFRKRNDLTYEVFHDRWHNSHTPLSLKIHPLWNYNRNVTKPQSHAHEPWDGIVEEQFKTKSDILNPVKFFGHPLIMPYRMWQVYSDTKRFLDYNTIEPYFAREVYIKS